MAMRAANKMPASAVYAGATHGHREAAGMTLDNQSCIDQEPLISGEDMRGEGVPGTPTIWALICKGTLYV